MRRYSPVTVVITILQRSPLPPSFCPPLLSTFSFTLLSKATPIKFESNQQTSDSLLNQTHLEETILNI